MQEGINNTDEAEKLKETPTQLTGEEKCVLPKNPLGKEEKRTDTLLGPTQIEPPQENPKSDEKVVQAECEEILQLPEIPLPVPAQDNINISSKFSNLPTFVS